MQTNRFIARIAVAVWMSMTCLEAMAESGQGYHLRPSVCDVPFMKTDTLLDLSDGQTWDSVTIVQQGRITSVEGNSVHYNLPYFIYGDQIDSSSVYARWRDGQSDTLKIHLHYINTVEPWFTVEKEISDELCFAPGREIEQQVRITTTCPSTWLTVYTGFDRDIGQWEDLLLDVSKNGQELVPTEQEPGYRIYDVPMHAGDVLEYHEKVRIDVATLLRTAALGEILLEAEGSSLYAAPLFINSMKGYCKDLTYELPSCSNETQLLIFNSGISGMDYELLTTETASGSTVSMDDVGSMLGIVYYVPKPVTQRTTDIIRYARYLDGQRDEGELTIHLLPCIASVETKATVNEICNDAPCDYDGPSILINEVMISPKTGDGAIYDLSPRNGTERGGEWVELYNPDPCNPVDISGYFFGNATEDDSIANYNASNQIMFQNLGAAFVLPEGTVVPPNGYCVLRGETAEAVDPANLVENGGNCVVVDFVDYMDRFCLDPRGWRFWLPNKSGWFAFYNRDGVPQDAVRWGPANQASTCTGGHPCTPSNPTFNGTLASFDEFPDQRKAHPYLPAVGNSLGMSLGRSTDAGGWNSSIHSPTIGRSNSQPYHRTDERCSGTATVVPHGGEGPFAYLWNDARQQQTATATGLCEGNYCCEITDLGTGLKRMACISLRTHSKDCPNCPDEPASDTIEVSVDAASYQIGSDTYTESGLYCRILTTAEGCDSLACVRLTLNPATNPPGQENHAHEHSESGNSDTQPDFPCDEHTDIHPDVWFTPNNDGNHDLWTIENIRCRNHQVYIFDKFGKLLRFWDNDFDGWNGIYRHHPLPSDDYWYLIFLSGEAKPRSGHVTLKR